MQASVATVRQPNARADVTNSPRRLSAGTDLRSLDGRRFADIFDGLALEFGPAADPARLREIAVLKFELEKAQASGACSLEDTVRVHNLIGRKEAQLRAARRAAASKPPPLSAYLNAKAAT